MLAASSPFPRSLSLFSSPPPPHSLSLSFPACFSPSRHGPISSGTHRIRGHRKPHSFLLLLFPSSSQHGGEGAEHDLLAGDGEAHVVVDVKLLLGLVEEALELQVGEIKDRNDEPVLVLPNVHREVVLRHVPWQPLLLSSTPPQARAPLQYLLQHSHLRELVRLPYGHSPFVPSKCLIK